MEGGLPLGRPDPAVRPALDLGESHDVAAAHPEVVAKIEAYLKTARTESSHWPMTGAKSKSGGKKKAAKSAKLGSERI